MRISPSRSVTVILSLSVIDENLLEAVLPADHVLDLVQLEHADAGQLYDDGVGGRSAGAGAGRGRWMRERAISSRVAFAVASQAVRGVTRPGTPWWGRGVLLSAYKSP
jgi:hypothetical protein